MRATFNSFDFKWVAQLFGTAVGAGILFLPISAGAGGFWVLFLITLGIGPLIYGAHRGLARMVLKSAKPGQDITSVMGEFFGPNFGKIGSILYFSSIFPILLIYGVSITNTVDSFMVNQLGMQAMPRYLLSFVLNAVLVLIMLTDEKIVLRITGFIVFPLCLILFGLSIYLIPEWNLSMVKEIPSFSDGITSIWVTIPLLIFAFNHAPAISTFSLSVQKEYKENTEKKANQILGLTSLTLVLFVMFFVFSCVLSLSAIDLAEAKAQNITILSYIANIFDSPFISILGPVIAMLAIISSFFGHYMGAAEGITGIIKLFSKPKKQISEKRLRYTLATVFFLILWVVSTLNPSVLSLIESLVGPILAMILFLMPIYAIYTIPSMAKYKKGFGNIVIVLVGLIAVSNMLLTFF